MSARSDERAAEYFHRIADEWDAIYDEAGQGLSGRLNRVLRKDMWLRYLWVKDLMAQSPRGSVLDIGCGNGVYAIALAEQGHQPILAVDLAEAALERARAAVDKAECSKAIETRVADGFFEDFGQVYEVALAVGVFDYVGEPLPALQATRRQARRLLATFPRADTWRAPVRKLRLSLRGCPVFFYRRRALEELIREAGWEIASWTTHGCLYCLDLRARESHPPPPLCAPPRAQPGEGEPGGSAPELAIIIASRNRRERLAECLQSIRDTVREAAYEVILVDDVSTDGSPEMVAAEFPEVKVLRNPSPNSWTVTNNQGIRESRGRYLLLLNDDVRLLPAAVDRAVRLMREHPGAGVVTPRIVNPDRTVQPMVRRFPDLAAAVAQSLDLHRFLPKNRLTARYYAGEFDYSQTQRAESVATTCYLLRRECYEQVGVFDESFPPNFSDAEFNWRVKEAGWETWVRGDVEVIHYGGATMGLFTLRQLREYHRGMFKMYRKHYASRYHPLVNLAVYGGIGARWLGKSLLRLTLLDRLLHRLPQPHRRRPL